MTLAPYGFFWFSLLGTRRRRRAVDAPTLPGSMPEVLRRKAGPRASTRTLAAAAALVRRQGCDHPPGHRRRRGRPRHRRQHRVARRHGVVHRGRRPALHRARCCESAPNSSLRANGCRPSPPSPSSTMAPLLIDAMIDQRGAASVVGAALRRRVRTGRHGELRGQPRRTRLAKLADDPRNVHLLGVEQSNSSVIIDNTLIAKLVRRLEPGLNPDVELPIHLSAAGFERVPRVAATLDIDLGGESLPANVVIVHDAIAHESDLWVKVLDDVGLAIDLGVPIDDTRRRHRARNGRPARDSAPPRLHLALARTDVAGDERGTSPMAPESFTLLWQRSILQTLRNSVRATQRELTRARRSRDARRRRHRSGGAARLHARANSSSASIGSAPPSSTRNASGSTATSTSARSCGPATTSCSSTSRASRVRRWRNGRSSARRSRTSPASSGRGTTPAGWPCTPPSNAGESARANATRSTPGDGAWTKRMESEMLATYFDGLDGTGLVPGRRADRRLLLDIYVLVKAMYEVRYELANRPAWTSWPLTAISEMFDRVARSVNDSLRSRAEELGVQVDYSRRRRPTPPRSRRDRGARRRGTGGRPAAERGAVARRDPAVAHRTRPARPVLVTATVSEATIDIDGTADVARTGPARRRPRRDRVARRPAARLPRRSSSSPTAGPGETVVVVAPADHATRRTLCRSAGALFAPTYALWERDQPLPSFRHLHDLRPDGGSRAASPWSPRCRSTPHSSTTPTTRARTRRSAGSHWNEVFIDDAELPAARARPGRRPSTGRRSRADGVTNLIDRSPHSSTPTNSTN